MQFFELCIACGFLEPDSSHSLADIFLIEIDLRKTVNNQCFFQLLHQREAHNINQSEKMPIKQT